MDIEKVNTLAVLVRGMEKSLMPIVLYGGLACAGVSIAIFGCMLSSISADMGLTTTQAGVAQAVYFVGHLLGALITGRLMGSYGSRWVWMLGLGATVAGGAMTAIPSFEMLMLGRMLAGFGLASSVLFASAAIATMYPTRTGVMLNLMHAIIAGAAALTLAFGQPLGHMLGNWTHVLWFSAFLGAVPLLLAAVMPTTPSIESDEQAGFGVLGKVLMNPLLLALIPAIVGYVAIEQAITVFLPQLIQSRFEVEVSHAANLTAMLWLGIIIGRIGSVVIGSRIHNGVQLVVGGIGMGLCMMMTLVVDDVNAIPLLVLAAGIAGGPMVPLAFAMAADRMKESRNSAMTICQLACCAGGIYGPLVAGTVGDATSLPIALMFGFATVIVAVVPLVRSLPVAHHEQTEPQRPTLQAAD